MALKLNERYPGRFNNPSADYPQGSFKNRTSPTAKDGSYLEQDWANDKEGFFQSLISVAGTVPSGVADKVGTSQYYDALLTVLYAAGRKTPILNDTGTAGAYAAANTPALTVLPASGYMQRVKIANLNPGASTYAPDGLAAKPIYGLGLQPLQGGELPVGVVVLMYLVQASVNGGNGAWIIIESLGGASQVSPATKSQHAMQLGQAVGRLIGVQVFTATATYTPTPGTNSVVVECIGSGGGSGSCQGTGATAVSIAGAGGGGGYAASRLTSGFSGALVTIGAGGTGGTAGANNAGAGSNTSFGGLLQAAGGVGGGGNATSITLTSSQMVISGAGGIATGGNLINSSGQRGTPGLAINGDITGGSGGLSGRGTLSGANGVQNGVSQSNQAGTAGQPGKVIVWEYA